LILGLKPRNRRGDFEAQITKSQLPSLGSNQKARTTLSLRLNQETVATGFEVKPLTNR
jgi:hypothetical protein